MNTYFSQSWSLSSLRSKCQQIQCLGRAPFLVHKWLSSCLTSHGGKGKGAFWSPLIKALIPYMRAPFSWPNWLPKALPPNTITLMVGFQNINFGVNKHSTYCIRIEIYPSRTNPEIYFVLTVLACKKPSSSLLLLLSLALLWSWYLLF